MTDLRADHVRARLALQQLHDEISDFQLFYDRTLGIRVAELDRIEAEISALAGDDEEDGSWSTAEKGAGRQEASWRCQSLDLKSLYREVAKSIHPDLGGKGAAAEKRNELMSKANRAYAEADRGTLQEILETWRQSRGEWDEEWAEVERFDILIKQEGEGVAAVKAKIAELEESFALRLKRRMDQGTVGSDLLADITTGVDLNIARAKTRLAALMAEREGGRGDGQHPGNLDQLRMRRLHFPQEDSGGTLYLRDGKSGDYSQWKKLGPAKGIVAVPIEKSVRLDVKGHPGIELGWLRDLEGEDIQSLFLYELSDRQLSNIRHLTALEELYLSGSGITDSALSAISTLTNLKRIYIYQTSISDAGLSFLQQLPLLTGLTSSGNSITDAGLARFQRAIPRVKTVSFQWRR